MVYKVTFTQSDVNNLGAFLERINLQGREVSAFNRIINALNGAEKVEEDKTPVKGEQLPLFPEEQTP